jgi:hypothetical protein
MPLSSPISLSAPSTAAVNSPPTINSLHLTLSRGSSTPITDFFSAADPDGDPITGYEIWDPAGGNGHFTLNGTEVPFTTVTPIAPADLANLAWSTADQTGQAFFSVRATDGNSFGAWTDITVDVVDAPPVITSLNATVHAGQEVFAGSLFQASDADGDPIVQYELWDPTEGNGGFKVNGVAQSARQVISLSDVDVANNLTWDTTGQSGPTVFAVRAFDGISWGDWTTVTVNAGDTAPTVTSLNASARAGTQIAASALFQTSDAESDAITQYELWDPTAGNGGFTVNGVAQNARQVISLTAADFANLAWDTTDQSGSTVFAVRAFDGSLWSDWTTITVNATADSPPVITGASASVHSGSQVSAANLFQATDADGDAITQYELWDPTVGSGGFTLNGVAQNARQVISASPTDLANLAWDTTGQVGSAVFAVRAFDGAQWSDWTTVSVNANDAPPAITSLDQSATAGQQLVATDMFVVNDPDADAITQWEFWDPAAGNGGFTVNGTAQQARQVLSLTDAQVASGLAWDTSDQNGAAVFAVRAFDGTMWSDWTTVTVNANPAPAPATAPTPSAASLVQALATTGGAGVAAAPVAVQAPTETSPFTLVAAH